MPFSRRPQLASIACSKSTMTSRPLSCRHSMVSHAMRRFSSGVVSRDFATSSSRDLTTTTATGTRRLWRTMNCTSGHSWTFVPRPRVRPKSASFIAPVSTEARALVRSSTNWLAPAKPISAKCTPKAPMRCRQQYGVGHGDFEIRLLQPVAKAGVEQLDSSWCRFVHQCISPICGEAVGRPHVAK